MPATRQDFERELEALFRDSEKREEDCVEITASDLHRRVGGYPGADHRMPICCSAMRAAMVSTDVIVEAPPKGVGASLKIRYDLPRPDVQEEHQTAAPSKWIEATLAANFQRIGSLSNTQVGIDFETAAVEALKAAGVELQINFSVPVGVGALRKAHRFDLGSNNPPTLVECKCHRWTTGGNAPSAKLTVWNEAMYYFAVAPIGFRKIFFVLRDYSAARAQTLAEHYLSRYLHMVPDGVEFWEYDEVTKSIAILNTHK
jgi:hypothetical protein